jgi:hypothetical protein
MLDAIYTSWFHRHLTDFLKKRDEQVDRNPQNNKAKNRRLLPKVKDTELVPSNKIYQTRSDLYQHAEAIHEIIHIAFLIDQSLNSRLITISIPFVSLTCKQVYSLPLLYYLSDKIIYLSCFSFSFFLNVKYDA